MSKLQKEAIKRFKELKAEKVKQTPKPVGRPRLRTDEIFMEGLEREYDRIRGLYNTLNNTDISDIPTYKLQGLDEF